MALHFILEDRFELEFFPSWLSCGHPYTPKLGQNRKRGQLKKQTYNYLLIVFIVTLHSLQKNTVCRSCEQNVTTNPKLGQNLKSSSTEEAIL